MVSDHRYDLNEVTLDRIFEEQIVPILFANVEPAEHPLLILVGAQPGAGKTRAGRLAAREATSDVVRIIGDDLRQFHPAFETLLGHNPAAMPDATAQALSAWVERSIDYAISHRVSALVEGTFRNPDVPLRTARVFRRAGYAVHVVVVAVRPHISRASIAARYVHDAANNGDARFTSVVAHDVSFGAIEGTLEKLGKNTAPIGMVSFFDRTGLVERVKGAPSTGIPRLVLFYRRALSRPLLMDAVNTWREDVTVALRYFEESGVEAEELDALVASLVQDLHDNELTWIPAYRTPTDTIRGHIGR
ncbi:zeta toxin family protein [Curtobacterium sp. UNCCL17]|uniref:zeta toxin family protein n=1 Tax=Curtobacterium sp. UNCCL17 TaxID=1449051 RepID=UPI00047FA276|nr:zeta toxin family protein [Curtobacterium sp. UNCCL17]